MYPEVAVVDLFEEALDAVIAAAVVQQQELHLGGRHKCGHLRGRKNRGFTISADVPASCLTLCNFLIFSTVGWRNEGRQTVRAGGCVYCTSDLRHRRLPSTLQPRRAQSRDHAPGHHAARDARAAGTGSSRCWECGGARAGC